jgi:hypothetical protein
LQSSSLGTVTGFDIYNAVSNQKVDTLTPGKVIMLGHYGLSRPSDINFVATTSGDIGSVQFGLSQSSVLSKTKNDAPFVVCGNSGTDILTCPSLNFGPTTLTYTPYERRNKGGLVGTTSTLSFEIALKSVGTVTRLDIYNVVTNQKIDTRTEGKSIVLSTYGLNKPSDINFVAITAGVVGSVQFSFSGNSFLNKTENYSSCQEVLLRLLLVYQVLILRTPFILGMNLNTKMTCQIMRC